LRKTDKEKLSSSLNIVDRWNNAFVVFVYFTGISLVSCYFQKWFVSGKFTSLATKLLRVGLLLPNARKIKNIDFEV